MARCARQVTQVLPITSAPLLLPSRSNLFMSLSRLRDNPSRDAKIRSHDCRQSPSLTSGVSKVRYKLGPSGEVDAWLTVSRDNSEEQNRVPDKQDAFRPHRQRTDLKEKWISSLREGINSVYGRKETVSPTGSSCRNSFSSLAVARGSGPPHIKNV